MRSVHVVHLSVCSIISLDVRTGVLTPAPPCPHPWVDTGHAGLPVANWTAKQLTPSLRVFVASIPTTAESRQLWVDGVRVARAHAASPACSGGRVDPATPCEIVPFCMCDGTRPRPPPTAVFPRRDPSCVRTVQWITHQSLPKMDLTRSVFQTVTRGDVHVSISKTCQVLTCTLCPYSCAHRPSPHWRNTHSDGIHGCADNNR